MPHSNQQKSTTSRLLAFEPNEELLHTATEGRQLSPELMSGLKRLLNSRKWAQQVNIPSSHNAVAAVMVFTSSLKEGGLEILSEMHVFYEDKRIVEKWIVVEEKEPTSSQRPRVFRAAGIEKVQVDGTKVHVSVRGPLAAGGFKTIVKTFDFASEPHDIRVVPHPFVEHG
jgi:hypothetical protein